MAKTSKAVIAVTMRWAIVLRGGGFHLLPYDKATPESILCYVCEGDKEWTRVANFCKVLRGHRNPDAEPEPWERDDVAGATDGNAR